MNSATDWTKLCHEHNFQDVGIAVKEGELNGYPPKYGNIELKYAIDRKIKGQIYQLILNLHVSPTDDDGTVSSYEKVKEKLLLFSQLYALTTGFETDREEFNKFWANNGSRSFIVNLPRHFYALQGQGNNNSSQSSSSQQSQSNTNMIFNSSKSSSPKRPIVEPSIQPSIQPTTKRVNVKKAKKNHK